MTRYSTKWLLVTIVTLLLAMYFDAGVGAFLELLAFIFAILAVLGNLKKERTSS